MLFSGEFAILYRLLERAAHAPLAQLDRVFDYESKGRGFESPRARQKAPSLSWRGFAWCRKKVSTPCEKSGIGIPLFSIHQFLAKWHFRKRKRSFCGQKLIKEANFICSSATYMPPPADENRRGCGPFDASPGFFDRLKSPVTFVAGLCCERWIIPRRQQSWGCWQPEIYRKRRCC